MSARTLSILVVDDEPAYVDALSAGLRREGFVVESAMGGRDALEAFDAMQPDLVLLDVMLPQMSGIDVCREIRTRSTVPIIMVSAKTDEVDAVVGLEVGADDYVTKPYRMRELVSRIRALLRRAQLSEPTTISSSGIVLGDLVIDPERHQVRLRGSLVSLPLKEFMLLAVLAQNLDRVVSRDRLIREVWGWDYVGSTKTLDVHVMRLRAKIEDDPAEPRRLITARGLGYRLVAPDGV
ncbi:MAG: response regulator transcription factor [Acidimicrobiales bacterium]|nr:response regulator transcription factor [Acidimicrobiales bacterium]